MRYKIISIFFIFIIIVTIFTGCVMEGTESQYVDQPPIKIFTRDDYVKVDLPVSLHIAAEGTNTDVGYRIRHRSQYTVSWVFDNAQPSAGWGDIAPDGERVGKIQAQSELGGKPPQATSTGFSYTANVATPDIYLVDSNYDCQLLHQSKGRPIGEFGQEMAQGDRKVFYYIPVEVEIQHKAGEIWLDERTITIPYKVWLPLPGKDVDRTIHTSLSLLLPVFSVIDHKIQLNIRHSHLTGTGTYYSYELDPDNDIPVLGQIPVVNAVLSLVYTAYDWIKNGNGCTDISRSWSTWEGNSKSFTYKLR